jgi:hypothetical protein
MTLKKPVVTTIFLAIWLSGCTHYYYVANVQNVPLFKEKNEFRLSGAYGFGDYSECTEVQAAYANVFNKSDLSFIEQPHISIGLYIAIAERYR